MADQNDLVSQDEIERLLKQRSSEDGLPADAPQETVEPPDFPDGSPKPSEIQDLLRGADEDASAGSSSTAQASQASGSPDLAGADGPLKPKVAAQSPSQTGSGTPGEASPPITKSRAPQNPLAGDGSMAEGDVEYLLNQAEQALQSIDSESDAGLPSGLAAFELRELSGEPPSTESATLELLSDVHLDLKIELGRTHMYLEDVLKLRKGSVVPLDKLAGDPVDIYVNERLIARGEVLVLNDNFCVRVGELIAGSNRSG